MVFDEAHNIDNVCIEALSVRLNKRVLDAAVANVTRLIGAVDKVKEQDEQRLREEYGRLVNGLALGPAAGGGGEDELENPVLPDDILQEAIPGNVRKACARLGKGGWGAMVSGGVAPCL